MDKANDSTLLRHQISMSERKSIAISGIKKIISFDDEEFLLESVMGVILLKGNSLEIIKLDTSDGNVSIKGNINGINYIDENINKNKENFFVKLFK